MKFSLRDRVALLLFVLLSFVFFRQYFFQHRVPLPANLLVSFYSPWRYESIPGYPHGVPNKPIGSDIPKLFYPFRKFTTDQLLHGRIPLWNPYVFSGNVHLATYQSAVFYPFNILYFLFPLIDAWSLLVIIQPILSGWFMYLFLESLFLSKKSSFFGAIAFAFSGWMVAWWEESIVIEHTILWLPLALYGSNVFWQQKKSSHAGLLVILASFAMSLFAGFLQMSLYLFATVGAWNIYHWYQRKSMRNLLWIVIVGLLALLITSVQWLPALEVYQLSARGTTKATFLFEDFLMPIRHLLTFIAPDFWGNPGSYNYFFPKVFYHEKVIYIGIFPLLFALFALVRQKGKEVRFWKVFSLVTLSLGFTLPTSWIWYILRIPILSVAQPTRIFVLATFGFCVLAAYGLELFLQEKKWISLRSILLFLSGVLGGMWVFVLLSFVIGTEFTRYCVQSSPAPSGWIYEFCRMVDTHKLLPILAPYASVSLRNLILPTFFVGTTWGSIIFLSRKTHLFYGIILGLTLFGSLYFANKFLYFSSRQFVFPIVDPIARLMEISGNSRIWSYGNAYIEKNIPSYFGLYSPEGYDALFSSRYGELLYSIKNGGQVADQIPRTDVDLKPASEKELLIDNPIRLKIMSLVDVRYILETKTGEDKKFYLPEERFPQDQFHLVWENPLWRIWEYKNALPRTFFVNNYIVENNKQGIVDLLLRKIDLKSTIVIEEPAPFHEAKQEESNSQAEARILSYEPERVVIGVSAPTQGFVFLSDTFFPGWKAYVDGVETKIYRADYAFRAVPLNSGIHTVIFEYRPWSFSLSVGLTLVGCMLSLVYIWVIKRHSGKVL